MDFEKISSYDFMIKVFAKYHRQLLKELDKEYRRRDDIDPPADDIIRQHLAEYHSRCPVCVVDDDPPTRLSGTMEPSAPWKVGEPAINIVLKEDGPHTTFVEIETDDGRSIGIGTRLFSDKDYTEYTRLRITADEIVVACRKLPPEPEHQFVTRGDFEQFRAWLSQQRTAEWTRLMEHSHDNDGPEWPKVVFPNEKEEEK